MYLVVLLISYNDAKVDDQYEWTDFVIVLIMVVELLMDGMVVECRMILVVLEEIR